MSSKNSSGGPSASSFENPRKVGWLHKHGGSGMKSHWKKRWFIVDHHYMFYYKGPTDKKPVGILCLPEYQSCHSTKDSKKANSFMLDKGNLMEESTDSGPLKNYVLCSDSEEEMRAWVSAITEEIKPLLGVAPTMYGKKKEAVKVDQKAFDEVTAIASEGPKLTHLTTSRPKMKGRRPPKRYQVFHEEEDDSVESPPSTPTSHQHKPLPPSPSSPSNSPIGVKKGSRPATPMLPSKPPMTPPTKPKVNSDQAPEPGETILTSSPKFSKPQPPRKMISRVDMGGENHSPSSTPVSKEPTKPIPKPPPKPRTSIGSSPPQSEVALENHVDNTKPRPAPPSNKPRPKVKPRPTIHGEPLEASLTQQQDPTKKPAPAIRPTPVPRKRASAEVKVDEEKPPEEDHGKEPSVEDAASTVPEPSESAEMGERRDSSPQRSTSEEQVTSEEQLLLRSPDHTHEEAEEAAGGKSEQEEVQKQTASPEHTPEHTPEREEEEETTYEDMATPAATGGDDAETYELMEYDHLDGGEAAGPAKENSVDSTQKGNEEGEGQELDAGSPNYVPMGQASLVKLGSPASDTYEEMEVGGSRGDKDSIDYENAEGWGDTSRCSSMGFEPKPVVVPEESPYDILPPPRPLYTNGDPTLSAATTGPLEGLPDTRPPQFPEVSRRSHSLSSCGSSSSGRLEYASMQARKGSKCRTSVSSSRSNSVSGTEANLITSSSSDVAAGKRMDRLNSLERKGNISEKSLDSSDSHSVSGTLQQAKEILRLALSMKAEAEEMKEEAYRELELARRERHDASLLKKNAAEILRIAKSKLAA